MDRARHQMDSSAREQSRLGLGRNATPLRWARLTNQGAMYHILDKIVKTQDEGWKKDKAFAETTIKKILRPGYWADQLNMGLPNLHHSRSMRPFCRQMSNIPDSPNKQGAAEHLVYLVSPTTLVRTQGKRTAKRSRCHIYTGRRAAISMQ